MEAAVDMPAHLRTTRSGRAATGFADGEKGRAREPAIVVDLTRRQRAKTTEPVKAELVVPPIVGRETLFLRLADLLLTWLRRSQQRRQLGSLSDRMLKDIGVSRADVDYEVSRRFWRD